jgi:hypothetical protein
MLAGIIDFLDFAHGLCDDDIIWHIKKAYPHAPEMNRFVDIARIDFRQNFLGFLYENRAILKSLICHYNDMLTDKHFAEKLGEPNLLNEGEFRKLFEYYVSSNIRIIYGIAGGKTFYFLGVPLCSEEFCDLITCCDIGWLIIKRVQEYGSGLEYNRLFGEK